MSLRFLCSRGLRRRETCSRWRCGFFVPIGEQPFPIPSTWMWVHFGEVTDHRLGKMLDKAKNRGQLRPYLRNANVRWFAFDLGGLLEMRVGDKEA